MPKQYYGQRQHLVKAQLNSVLYQLHTLSFFLSPSLWSFVFRIISQSQCAAPKDIDISRSLRAHFTIVFLLNLPNLWTHIFHGAAEGRAIILDFIGMAYIPSKLQLFALDITILSLQWITVAISYETAVSANSEDGEDTLLSPDQTTPDTPLPSSLPTPATSRPPSPSSSRTPSFFRRSIYTTPKPNSTTNMPPEILDLRLQTLIARLRNPVPPVTRRTTTDPLSLPFPNTTPFQIPPGMRSLMRAQAARRVFETNPPTRLGGSPLGPSRGNVQRIPGSMDRDS
ncbi:hypothetical protein CC1G_04552 [Coprinopsis cinerea okayama7|uniref:DUF1746 domain-containing protein n=1 Tax=Coprinopsis cinerea (strain Okayama-7 / 130 / ATCC MYA-4618 / FGSC 9003) TaxID=240176 RepID=A8N5H4_COPC7|nr:hypothetical protein CC1G_04552 [Coprinopsis cinerea okayama7\|eukprot:XP_001830119.2 hypothetical protein CC1G_04552 [Coprinopsis cinerea okayama7\